MSSAPPFIDPATGELDTGQIRAEAFPLAGLIVMFGALALVPFVLALLTGGTSGFGAILLIVGQFILAVGTGITLIYVVARGIQLADQ